MQLDGRYRFDNYVVGSPNRLAVAAARAVAEAPGASYNPLFIQGGRGLGKTHLLSAIACHAASLHPALRVDAVTADEFARQRLAAATAGRAAAFRERYQHAQLLLIDDVHFLSTQPDAQAELLWICEATGEPSRQLVVTSDRPVAEMAGLDEGLARCLQDGLVVDLGAPDYDTRLAILGAWSAERDVRFPPGVLDEAARIDVASLRDLHGALSRLIAFQQAAHGGLPKTTADDVRRLFPGPAAAGPRGRSSAPAPTAATRVAAVRADAPAGEYLSFLSDVAHAVARHVEPWRTRLAECVARWSGEGYRVAVLERALRVADDPGADAIVAAFEAAVERLRALEAEAAALDATLDDAGIFRDPERLAEAEAVVQALAEAAAESLPAVPDPENDVPVPAAASAGEPIDSFFLDPEKVVWEWPEPAGRAIEELR